MKLVDVDGDTEATFLRCLHDERPDDPRETEMRRSWLEANRAKGLRTKVLVLDTGEVAALCQYAPVEHTHFVGEDLFAIYCVWVHGYDHHIGNRQGNGYGRFILEAIESDARESGAAGVVTWGMDFPYWNPISFYEHMGYERVEQSGMTVLAWKPFRSDAKPPRFIKRVRSPETRPDRVTVTAFVNGCCNGFCGACITARDAVDGLDGIVDYQEIDVSDPDTLAEWGIIGGLYVEGEAHRPNEPPCSPDVLRRDILNLAKKKGLRVRGEEDACGC